jgi:hypothetical protein
MKLRNSSTKSWCVRSSVGTRERRPAEISHSIEGQIESNQTTANVSGIVRAAIRLNARLAAAFLISLTITIAALAAARPYRIWKSGTITLTAPTKIAASRIVLDDCTIITNGFDLEIEASDEIHTFGHPRIVSFAESNRDAAVGQDGRPAGKVKISAGKIQGSAITIANVGQNGGVGLSGVTGSNGVDGGPGRPAQSTFVLVRTICTPGGDGLAGGPGGAGQSGAIGGAGGRGGDVLIRHSRNVDKLLVDTSGGHGGRGGRAGMGGQGGKGGPGGASSGGCPGGRPGTDGIPGQDGSTGATGKDGHDGEVRFEQSS